MSQKRILIIEDDSSQREILSDYLVHHGFSVVTAMTGSEGIKQAQDKSPDLILLDYKLPDADGLEVLTELKERLPLTPVIIITAFGSVDKAVNAMRAGAFYYLTKPVHLEELLLLIERALKKARLEQEVASLRRQVSGWPDFLPKEIIAQSSAMKELLNLARKVAETEATVLLLGESGTGKEVLAELIHRLSPRRDKPLVRINCAAIPGGLLESELFGHEKGAFTGATKAKQGLFEAADHGTIFLDEIGDLPLELQAKLLRVLQNGTFTRVGSVKEIKVDVRVIAATNRNLEEMVKEEKFREDLFWRLNVFSLNIPALRQRREDIGSLADFFCSRFAQKYNKKIKGFTRKALEALLTYDFPGNVRELENIVERAVILTESDYITLEDLPPYLHKSKGSNPAQDFFDLPLMEAVEKLEKMRIAQAMQEAEGIKTKAAKLLGISERVLRYKLAKYGLE
jgi:DNA-binding NtrC family response regulator